ncbi:DNA-dependent metalloprotease SPRTN [Tachysurus vachellii]|uniref:DNA-dependent metalloprotease SPRTN n=1 Tax=Tachysurus vachellii TaxID=175792 RepID=UPI00296AFADD|nr:DNA-dependent metalloprotease SPRTN [Tachysurus vachellii]
MADEDFLLALQLQEQFDKEVSAVWSDDNTDSCPVSKKRKVETCDFSVRSCDFSVGSCSRPDSLSIVDESWEMLDPNPDVRAMFLQFNEMFFWGKLSGVEVKWSPRMTLCAGVCSYEGRGGLCSIRLSEPLLKLRPRKDLVETLLHEMIHALLFVTQNNRDRDGHGPEFCKHMNRINQASGTKISIYHSFHDEVDVYRQHWWRCNGPCQNRKPFFGYVKRAMNRAPSHRDPWWEDHRRTCGGTYTKIKEPENYGKKGKSEEEKKDKNALKKSGGKMKAAGSTEGSRSQDIRNVIPFSGRGIVLGGSTQPSAPVQNPPIQSPTRSPKPLQEPVRTSPADLRSPYSSTTALPKKSISNHKAFVNINGSPVRVTKTNGSLMRPKQTTVQDLFKTAILKSPKKTNPSEPKRVSDTPALETALNLNSAKTGMVNKSSSNISGSAGSPFSKYFVSAKSTGTGSPGQIKPGNAAPGFTSWNFRSSKGSASASSGSGPTSTNIPTSNSIHSESLRHPGTYSTQFGSPKGPGSEIRGFSSTTFIKSESSVSNSSSRQFGSQNISGTGSSASPSIPSSNSRLSGSPEKSGSFMSTSRSPHRPGSAAGGRKRWREDRISAHIFDFFQRSSPSSSSSLVSREHIEERTGAVLSAGASGVGNTLHSSAALTVTCPVCQSKVPESQINQHLDSCLT